MNKFSLISIALSALFCWNANASEQSISDSSSDSSATVSSEPASEAPVAEEAKEEPKVKKAKISKKKRSKKCSKSCKRTNAFTEKLNKNEDLGIEPNKDKVEPKGEATDK